MLWLLAPVSCSVYRRLGHVAGCAGHYYARFTACCHGCGASALLWDALPLPLPIGALRHIIATCCCTHSLCIWRRLPSVNIMPRTRYGTVWLPRTAIAQAPSPPVALRRANTSYPHLMRDLDKAHARDQQGWADC